ncbi:MlrC C-terminal domain-containing protein [Thalassovita taeanensis]|uniref:Metallopeptidase family M81 n=1 Tax=Thalassovita taeanensis TaxID=657014 RepID=A0A1H9BY96_9RHOB|nr:MlrC C-terminal domain-containing protein [Thalassovita taeanensis]SEP93986.1 Metallopeptidase family M81 [Thalassovita taeanensis]
MVADELTTALDVTVQAQIVDLLLGLVRGKGVGLLLMTHDMGMVAHSCDRACVMYCSGVVETGAARDVFGTRRHPYIRACDWEASAPGTLAVSVNGAFLEADIEEVGPTVLGMYYGDPAPHQALADALADDIWDRRFEVLNTFYTVEEVAALVADYVATDGPLIIADYADNPVGGPIIGGLTHSYGPTAVILVYGTEFLIITLAIQIWDQQQFRAFGIDPTAKTIVGLTSMQHFRAAFEDIAGKIVICDKDVLCTLDHNRLPYKKVPRPIFPLDRGMALDAQ